MFVLYGAGGVARNILSVPRLRRWVAAVADIDQSRHGTKIIGVPIISPNNIKNFSDNMFVTIDIDRTEIMTTLNRICGCDITLNFLNEPND